MIFFSFISDPVKPIPERFMYFNYEQRQDLLSGKIKEESPDSHTSIAHFNGYSAVEEDYINKYEFNPLTGKFTIDQINNRVNDSKEAEIWIRGLDFKKIAPALIIKPIVNPFTITPPEITSEILELIKQWNSVWDSVRNSVGNSVWDSVWAYSYSFFKINYGYDFSPCVHLWEMGLVPSFDGKIWRLHGDRNGRVVWEGII